MFNVLRIGSSGMKAEQKSMDNIADQIANVSTDGYKKKRIDFNELLMNKIDGSQVKLSANAKNPGINAGAKSDISKIDFSQGEILPSENNFHIALEGAGFFGVFTKQGNLLLTRNGGFHQNSDKSVTDDSGNRLSIEYTVPEDKWPQSTDISINKNGLITTADSSGNVEELGKVILYMPENDDSLISLGKGDYIQEKGATLFNSKDNADKNYGDVRQKALESSNVDMIQSMTDMIATQRSYQANAKSIETTDEMLSEINSVL